MGLVLFVIAVMQLMRAPADLLYEFIDDEPDHSSKYGNYEHS